MIFKKGDIVYFKTNALLIREIVKVYSDYYEWKYLHSDEVYSSKNSNDIEMIHWNKIKTNKL